MGPIPLCVISIRRRAAASAVAGKQGVAMRGEIEEIWLSLSAVLCTVAEMHVQVNDSH